MTIINTNVSSMQMQRGLADSMKNINVSMQRLSSGIRINNASDDAAGLVLTEEIKSQSSSTQIAKNNVQTGIALLQTADSAYEQVIKGYQKLKDIAIQAANGVYSDEERANIDVQYQQIVNDITSSLPNIKFGDLHLFNTANPYDDFSLSLQIGTNNNPKDFFDITITCPYHLVTSVGSVTTKDYAQNFHSG